MAASTQRSARGALALIVAGAVLAAIAGYALATRGSQSPAAPGRAELARSLNEIERFVERTRHLRFKHPVQVVWVGPHHRWSQPKAPTWKHLEAGQLLMKLVGFFPEDANIPATSQAALQAGVRGHYDNRSKTLTVQVAALTPGVRVTIAHELTHALDDQWFGLETPRARGPRDDRGSAFNALMEGDAMWVQNAYRRALSPAEQAAVAQAYGETVSARPRQTVNGAKAAMATLIAGPYDWGLGFVKALVRSGGTHAIDGAFRRPPFSLAEVMFPARYLAGERPVPVRRPRADGIRFDTGGFGAALLAYALKDVSPRVAVRAVAAWGGGRYASWRDMAGRPCMRAAIAGRDRAGAHRIAVALTQWAAQRPRRTIGRNGTRVVVVSCLSRAQ